MMISVKPPRRCVNCDDLIPESWTGRKYCPKEDCLQAARVALSNRAEDSPWFKTAKCLKSRGLEVPWHQERPCKACGRPYVGTHRRLYCENEECLRARNREKEKARYHRRIANPEFKTRVRKNAKTRNKKRYATDPEYAAKVKRTNRLAYARRTGGHPDVADLTAQAGGLD